MVITSKLSPVEFHGFWTNWNIEIPEVRFTLIYGTSRSQMLIKIGVIKNFAKFTGKHLYWDTFLIKLHALRPEKRLQLRCFPKKFAKFLWTSFLTEHLHWLLLNIVDIMWPMLQLTSILSLFSSNCLKIL